jgi:hypothetical protein
MKNQKPSSDHRKVQQKQLEPVQQYQHVGEPIYFTSQKGYISSNHNLLITYREALAV